MELERDILIAASPETIFGFLTDPDLHVRWMGTAATLEPRPGGRYEVLVADQFRAAGEFVEVVPDRRVVFTFGWDQMDDSPVTPGSSTVEITLEPEGDKTRLRLRHTGLPDQGAVDSHIGGWDHYLGRLATAAPGGDAGPDTGPGA